MKDFEFGKGFRKAGKFMRRFRDSWDDSSQYGDFCYPDVDMIDEGDEILIKMDLPGVTRDDIELNVTKDAIEVSAEKEEEEEDEKDYYLAERIYSGFYRRLALPEEIIPEETYAKFSEGVLEINAKKAGTEKTQIEVE